MAITLVCPYVSFLFFLIARCAIGGNVLFIPMCNSPSHRTSMLPLAEKLAEQGHSVTIFAENPEDDKPKGKNVTIKLVVVPYDIQNFSEAMNNIVWHRDYFSPLMMWVVWDMCVSTTEEMLQQRRHEFDQVLSQYWDLIIVDVLFTPTGMLFPATTRAPYLLYGTTVFSSPESFSRSIPLPTSTFPAMFLTSHSYDHARFIDRLSTAWSELQYVVTTYMVDRVMLNPRTKSTVPDIFIHGFYKGADGVVIDYPNDLDYPRPWTRDMIHAAGKCKDHVLRDEHLLEFVEDPNSKGTIVIAFGHQVRWPASPEHVKINFAKALNMLKDYRIFWQFPGEPPVKMEPHVKTMTWLPQIEILNHPKTRVFVSHAGLKSVMEAVCAQVPMVVIPFFAEQIHNGMLMKRGNAGVILNKFHLTSENIVISILEVATNDGYHNSARKLKWSVLDKPISPAENGLFWCEFAIRHKGLPKTWFQLKGANMSWVTYFCIDIVSVTTIIGCFTLFGTVKLAKLFVAMH